MSNLSVDEVERAMLDHVDKSGWRMSSWSDWAFETPRDGEPVDGLGTVFLEKQHGGEGQGDEYWAVFKVVDGDSVRYFRIEGYYLSFSGGEFDGPFHEVAPVEKLVVFYE